MDVGTVSAQSSAITNRYSAQAQNVTSAKNAYAAGAATAQTQTAANGGVGAAYDIDISDKAKQAAAQASTDTVEESTEQTKGLSTDEINYLKQSAAMNEQTMLNLMIQALTDSNNKLQGWLDDGIGKLRFGNIVLDASRFGIPQVATNPEDAAKAVAPGGDWSVDAVSSRIFDLAEAMAGGDPDKLAEMRDAVEQGFKEAGVAWTNATGLSGMPDITQSTHDEIMKRFDKRLSELGATNTLAANAAQLYVS